MILHGKRDNPSRITRKPVAYLGRKVIDAHVDVTALAGLSPVRLWPELDMTPEQVDRIAEPILNFSQTYLRQRHPGRRQATVQSKRDEKWRNNT